MFDNLTEKLQRTFKNLRGEGVLTEENMGEALKEIRMALLEADVNFKVVKQLTDAIGEKAKGQEVMTALSPTTGRLNDCARRADAGRVPAKADSPDRGPVLLLDWRLPGVARKNPPPRPHGTTFGRAAC